ncbi:MAG: hypothetical protein GWO87_02260 [Xanthomonadaceae bacterium]|nr:hypothetical protein [Rhodospirillaceae bacterium]NIA17990.1 hypothetical protein [Xanthomonadaceae bacterium]
MLKLIWDNEWQIQILDPKFINYLEYGLLRRAKRRSNSKNISPIIGIASSVASLLSRKDSGIYVFRNPR